MYLQAALRKGVYGILVFSLAGCFGADKVIVQERTITHNKGITIITRVANVSLELESDGKSVPATKMSKEEFSRWMGDRSSRTLDSSIRFDETTLSLQSEKVSTRSGFNASVAKLNKRTKEISKFVRGSKKKLDIRKWQK